MLVSLRALLRQLHHLLRAEAAAAGGRGCQGQVRGCRAGALPQ
jgi:hypothetical protein